jgi:hypothetical protein
VRRIKACHVHVWREHEEGWAPVAHAYNSSYTEGRDHRKTEVQSQSRQIGCKTLSQKYPAQKRTSEMAQVVKSKHEVLSSNPSTTKTKEKGK